MVFLLSTPQYLLLRLTSIDHLLQYRSSLVVASPCGYWAYYSELPSFFYRLDYLILYDLWPFSVHVRQNANIQTLQCAIVMIAIYYTNAWGAKSQPFMSTRLRSILSQNSSPAVYSTRRLLPNMVSLSSLGVCILNVHGQCSCKFPLSATIIFKLCN